MPLSVFSTIGLIQTDAAFSFKFDDSACKNAAVHRTPCPHGETVSAFYPQLRRVEDSKPANYQLAAHLNVVEFVYEPPGSYSLDYCKEYAW